MGQLWHPWWAPAGESIDRAADFALRVAARARHAA
jgi:hypothetical protein